MESSLFQAAASVREIPKRRLFPSGNVDGHHFVGQPPDAIGQGQPQPFHRPAVDDELQALGGLGRDIAGRCAIEDFFDQPGRLDPRLEPGAAVHGRRAPHKVVPVVAENRDAMGFRKIGENLPLDLPDRRRHADIEDIRSSGSRGEDRLTHLFSVRGRHRHDFDAQGRRIGLGDFDGLHRRRKRRHVGNQHPLDVGKHRLDQPEALGGELGVVGVDARQVAARMRHGRHQASLHRRGHGQKDHRCGRSLRRRLERVGFHPAAGDGHGGLGLNDAPGQRLEAVGDVLNRFRGSPPAAIVLVTDGINTDGPSLEDTAVTARRRGVPLLIVGLGDDKPVRDLKLSDLLVDEVVFAGDVVQFDAKLTGNGFAGRKVQVRLQREDDARVLAETEVAVAADDQPQTVRIPYRPGEEGRFRYVVEVDPLEGEIQTDNNRLERTIEVRNQQIRVLLVEASPSFEFRYLSNTLTRDEGIKLDTVLQEADPEHVEDDATAIGGFPVSRDELFAYDVIILSDVNPDLLSTAMMENLAAFVDQPGKGGSLVLMAGPRYMPLSYRGTPLARLLPFRLDTVRYPNPGQTLYEGFAVAPSELGLTSPAMQLGDTPSETAEIWAHLPPLYWLMEVAEPKPGARVLAVASDRFASDGRALPVVLMQYVGAGKVLFHATDETWRWRWRVGDAYFARYWVQMIRYLSRSILSGVDRSAVLSSDRREYRYGESARLRLRFDDARLAPAEDDGAIVVVEHEGHQTRRIQLHRDTVARGVFEGVLSKPSVGDYHAWVAVPPIEGKTPAVDFSVAAPPGELQRVAMDAAGLRRTAKSTGGSFYTFQDGDRLLGDLPKGRHVPIESLPPIPLWNAWPMVLLVLVLLTTEWLLRKREGMA